MAPSLAQRHLEQLAGPPVVGGYEREDASAILRGESVPEVAAAAIHDKMGRLYGKILLDGIAHRHPELGRSLDSIAIRTMLDSESAASVVGFEDGSYAVLISSALQESLIRITNLICYVDAAQAQFRGISRRRRRDRGAFTLSARTTAMMRYFLVAHRTTGQAAGATIRLDESALAAASELVGAALMYIVAHEIGHVAHGHQRAASTPIDTGRITISEVQELQADLFAVKLLREILDSDQTAVWGAFIALQALFITEAGIFLRRGSSHPEGWARWAVLDQHLRLSDGADAQLRVLMMATVGGALQMGERFPRKLWPSLFDDPSLIVEATASQQTLERWDAWQTDPLANVIATAHERATENGRRFLRAVNDGDLAQTLRGIAPSVRFVDAIIDPSVALVYATFVNMIEAAGLTEDAHDGRLYAVAATRAIGGRLGALPPGAPRPSESIGSTR
jgi:hypothetical protein